jgi:tetratricopeptide (TPR) repeat protein
MAFAADETGARDLLLSLIPRIEQEDSDELMLEVLAQLGEIYLARGAHDGVRESIRRINNCLTMYADIGNAEHAQMIRHYSRRAQFLQTGLAAALGDHEGAATALTSLDDNGSDDGRAYLSTYARVLCATALCDDDLHVQSVPLWESIIRDIDGIRGGDESADHLWIAAATGYGRFCVETGRLSEAEPWLRRAGARAQAKGWELADARTQLELAAARWAANDHAAAERLASQAYPAIARYARAHDVSRCWLYLGLTRMASGALGAADECFEHAERHWSELGKPLHIHRILLQRSWIAIFRGRFATAVEQIAQARECLDSSPRSSWLQYARLDNHLGTVWRADALTDLGFDAAGDPDETMEETEARQAESLGVLRGEVGSDAYWRGLKKLEQAAELKVPAALAVDSVRYSIADADARSRWAASISAPMLAGAFAVAWEWENTELISELVEYHSARGTFSSEAPPGELSEWAATATAPALIDPEPALAAAGPSASAGFSLIRLGPLPPLQMQPDGPAILSHYRALALQRYGRDVTAAEPAWSTWP